MPMTHDRLRQKQKDECRYRKDEPIEAAGADPDHAGLAPAADANAPVRPPAERETQQDHAELDPAVRRVERALEEREIERRQHGANLNRRPLTRISHSP